MAKKTNNLRKLLFEIQAIAQNGLTYSKNIFNTERDSRLQKIDTEFMHYSTNQSIFD